MWLDTLVHQLKQSPFGTTYIDGASLEKLHFALPNQAAVVAAVVAAKLQSSTAGAEQSETHQG